MNTPQVSEPFQFQPKIVNFGDRSKPEKSTVDLVSCLLAVEAIEHWLRGEQYPIDLTEALNRLHRIKDRGQEIGILAYLKKPKVGKIDNLLEELVLQVKYAFTKYPIELENYRSRANNIDYSDDYVKDWYEGESCRQLIRKNWKDLKLKVINKFEREILYLEKTSIEPSLEFLKELASNCQSIETEIEKKSEEYLQKEGECREIYQRCVAALKNEDSEADLLSEALMIAQESLKKAYSFKVEKEVYMFAAQVLKELEMAMQRQIEGLEKSQEFLERVKKRLELNSEGNARILLADSLKIDFQALKQKILLHRLPTWVERKKITEKMLEEVLVKELKSDAERICMSTYNQLKKEFN